MKNKYNSNKNNKIKSIEKDNNSINSLNTNNEKNNDKYSKQFKWIFIILIIQSILVLYLLFKVTMFSMMMNMGGMDHSMMNMGGMDHGMMMNDKKIDDKFKFDRSISNLNLAKKSEVININDKEKINLSIDIIKKKIAGKEIRMFGYNGQIPGPLLHVKQGSEIYVNVTNNLDIETTIHWHGLRLDNKFDGVPGTTMDPQLPGESFEYKLNFVDEGIYWYHPHIREDYTQELGLYGNMLVDSKYDDYYNIVNREIPIILDDILIDGEDIIPFFDGAVTHALMGRFGNIMLVNGDDDYNLEVNKGEVIRFYITNVANTRIFNFSITGAQIKLIGSDIGSYEKEEYVSSIIIAPSQRYTIEVYFENTGIFELKNINPLNTYTLGKIKVLDGEKIDDYSQEFLSLRKNNYVKEDIDKFRNYFNKEIDAQIDLTIKIPGMNMGEMDHDMENMGGGMMMHEDEGLDNIEWEDTMSMMNNVMTNNTLEWILLDKNTGKENKEIAYKYKIGDKIKLRIFNDPGSMHPMQHPIHFHGQRFLVLDKDGVRNTNLVWKDTVLVPVGSSIDILLDITNPGTWMAHCHIAEHLQSGMMLSFKVTA